METCKKCPRQYLPDDGLTHGYCNECQRGLTALERTKIIGFCPKCGQGDWGRWNNSNHCSCGHCGWIARDFCPQCGRWHWEETILGQQGKCGACGFIQNCSPRASYGV